MDNDEQITMLLASARDLGAMTPPSFCEYVANNMELAATHSAAWQPPAQPSSSSEWYRRLLDFYLVHNRTKVQNLASLLEQFRGSERKLVRRIENKYTPLRVTGRHLDLAAQCAWVSAEEVVPHLFSLIDYTDDSVRYFFIDCRPESEVSCGKFGSAWHIKPESLLGNPGGDETSMLLEVRVVYCVVSRSFGGCDACSPPPVRRRCFPPAITNLTSVLHNPILHTHTHTYIHAYMHAYIHTHTCTPAPAPPCSTWAKTHMHHRLG